MNGLGTRRAQSPNTSVIGIDIGGANLKFATTDGITKSVPFPMWTEHQRLAAALLDYLADLPTAASLAVTMTGELADCFLDRDEGVQWIVNQTTQAAVTLNINSCGFYSVEGGFYAAAEAKQRVDLIAASNWHASAKWLAASAEDSADQSPANKPTKPSYEYGLVVDVGSTTTDLIPIKQGQVATAARTDFDRLREGSLVYVGCQRTPVAMLMDHFRFENQFVPVMNETFATIEDAMILTSQHPENEWDRQTADGRPKTKFHAANRLARMIGLDHRIIPVATARQFADQVIASASKQIHHCIAKLDPQGPLILVGHGHRLIATSDDQEIAHVSDRYNESITRVFPAYCVAKLFQSQQHSLPQ